MNTYKENEQFEILGTKLRLSSEGTPKDVAPSEVVALVNLEAQKVLVKSPQLDRDKVMLLVALQMAGEKIALEKEYRDNIQKLQTSAQDALQFIEEATPTTL